MKELDNPKSPIGLLKSQRELKTAKQNGSIVLPSLISLTLSACGGGGGSVVNPSPTNRSPVAAADSRITLDEDSDATELNISAPTDPDAGDTLTITVDSVPSGGEIRTASGELVSEGMSLTINELTGLTFTPNENVNSDIDTVGTFSYTVSDQAGGRDTSTVSFTINAIQDPPTITSLIDVAVDENTTSVMTIIGVDPDGDTLTYSISGGEDGALFQIDSSTGELSFIEKPDYENPKDADKDNIYSVEVTVDDGNGGTASQSILVTVNDTTTSMTISSQTINENDDGAIIGTVDTYIDDTEASGTVSYSISGAGSENFEIVDGELKLKDGSELDFESNNSYLLTLTATDENGPTTSFQFTISVNDVNDAPNGIALSSLGIPEQLDGADVGVLSISDQDSGDTFTYVVSDDRFEVVDGVLKLKEGTSVAYSDEQTITLTVTVTDAAGEEFTQEFTLLVGSIQITSTSFVENSFGAVVGELSVTDPDFSSNVTFTLSGDDAIYFEIINGQLKLKDDFSADYESKSSYSLTITATDDADNEATLTYTIGVTDVNEAPTAITLSASVIDENDDGVVVGTLGTDDEDAGDSHTYALSGDDADSFEVVDGQLKLKAGISANFEDKSSYAVTVTTNDASGLSFSQSFTITITDVNDVPSNIELSSNSLEGDSDGATVGTITVTDEDSGETFTYSVNDDRFEIVDGVLRLKSDQSVNLSDNSNIDLVITVTDSQGAEYQETVTIFVGGIRLDNYNLDENSDGSIVGKIVEVKGLDTTGVTYTLSGEDARYFELLSDGTLKLRDGIELDYERDDDYQVFITATNDNGESLRSTINISVNDIDEPIQSATYVFGRNGQLSLDSIWLKNEEGEWQTTNANTLHITIPEKDSDQEIYLFSIDVTNDQKGSYNLVVKSVSGFDVSSFFRFDSETGAVYLKAGSGIDFETSTGHYHAGTDAYSYGVYGLDEDISTSARPLIFSLEDESGSVDITYSGSLSSSPVYIVLDYGDTSDDGSLELGREMGTEGLVTLDNGIGEIVASAGGKDITGDGFPDTVLLINVDNTWLDLVIIPGGQDINGNVNEEAYLVTYWNYYYEYIPTDMELGDINGDGFADIVLGFGNETFTDYDYDGDGWPDETDGMVEIVHGASLQSLVNDPVTWTTFLSPNGSDSADFGTDIAIGDFNNDGFDDILVGAPFDGDGPLADTDEGAFHIIYGQSDLKVNTYDGGDLYGQNDYGVSIDLSSTYSTFSNSEMGDSVAVGDFNGDGIDDFAVSTNEAGLTEGDEGIVTIYLGQESTFTNSGDPIETVVINGFQSGSYMGDGQGSLQNLGDINGDGFDDLGIRDLDNNLFIVWGKSSWTADYDFNGDGVNEVKLIDASLLSSFDGDYLSGATLDSAFEFKGIGDINGDGFDDFLITTPYSNWDSNYSGSEYGVTQLIYGQSDWLGQLADTDLTTIEIKGNASGQHIISMGDYDNDGTDEFAFTNGYGTFQDLIVWTGQDNIDQSKPEPVINIDQNTVLENASGATIGNISFLNLNGGESVDYASIQISGPYSKILTISADGELKLKDGASLDYEANSQFEIQLSGTTSDGNSFSKYITIKVIDVNEAPTFNLSSAWVKDNATGASVGSVTIDNLDQFDTYTYSISGTDAQFFEIDDEGKLKFKDNVTTNFSNKESYQVTISVTDASGTNVSENVLIEVNSAPTDLGLTNNNIDESQRGIEIGSLEVTDPNTNDSYTYELSGEDAGMFEVTSDGTLKLKDGVYADYEVKSTLNVTIKVIDQGGLSVEKDFTVDVNDLAYATPYASDILSQANITESSNYFINAMLFGVRLDMDGDNSTQNTITYSVITPDSVFADTYYGNYFGRPQDDIVDPSQSLIDAIDRAFALIGSMTGINFVKVEETATQVGDIRIGLTDIDSNWAGISFVDYNGRGDLTNDSSDGDIWLLNYSGNTDGDWADGTDGFQTILHEIGHSLGLKHPHNAFFPNISGFDSPYMPSYFDSKYYTMMAYRDYVGDNLSPLTSSEDGDAFYVCGVCGQVHGEGSLLPGVISHTPKPADDDRKQINASNLISILSLDVNAEEDLDQYIQGLYTMDGEQIYPYTPMFWDIAALRYLYSYNQNTDTWFRPDTNSDDTIYFIDGPVNFTIFDTGGVDTIDFSTLDLDSVINLNDILSFLGTEEINYDDFEFTTGYIIGIYFFNEMENVRAGSGSDSITCNVSINEITCGPGDDSVYGISTGDSVFGDDGDDTFYYDSDDFNLISGGAGRDRLDISSQIDENPVFNLADIQGEIETIEEVYLGFNEAQNTIKVTADSIKNFSSQITEDQDDDGDPDTAIYILGDSDGTFRDIVTVSPDENWTYLRSDLAYDYYKSEDGETYFITWKGMGVYELSSDASISVSGDQSLRENLVNGEVGTLSLTGFEQLSPDDDVAIFTLGGEDADKFEITDGNVLRLKSGTKANYENQSSYNLTIVIAGVSQELVISVTDVTENSITGSSAGETLTGTDSDDVIDSGGGNDQIDGKSGIDSVLINDQSTNYEINTLAGITKIKALSLASSPYSDNTITLTNVENVEFSDTIITVDTTLNNATYIYGNGDSETLDGTNENDVFDPNGGSDEIDGKDGVDTVLIFDKRDNYEITIADGVVTIKALSSASNTYLGETITLTNIETIIFTDQTVQVSDLTSSSLTGKLIDQTDDDENDFDTEPGNSDDDNGLITLPDDQWVSGFELSMIDLPINADDIKADLSMLSFDSVDDLILTEDTMELNFDVFSDDEELIISMVKPVLESYMNTESLIPMENINDQAIWEDWNYQSI